MAANFVAKEGPYRRACHGELFSVPDSAMAKWVKAVRKVVIIDGCFLRCHGRILENLIGKDKLLQFDALSHYKKYTDRFDIDSVPEDERKAVAREVSVNKSDYDFSGRSGWLQISDVETIHYSVVEYLPGKRLCLAIHHDHPLIKQAFQRLVLIVVVLLVLFFFMIMIISYINISRYRELVDAQKAIIFSLARLVEHRDKGTGCHLERTRNYSVILAKQLRVDKKYRRTITNEFIEDLFDAAHLHDIGKVGIRDSILLKECKLTEEEYRNMKEHVQIGKQILQVAIDRYRLKQSFLVMGKNICAHHHEKYNGKGYPGLKGTEIPLEARIFALCDAYDTIRSKRPYKDKLSHEDAVERIKSDCGEHFGPDIVDAFLKCEKEFALEDAQS